MANPLEPGSGLSSFRQLLTSNFYIPLCLDYLFESYDFDSDASFALLLRFTGVGRFPPPSL